MWLHFPIALPFLSTESIILPYDPYIVTVWPFPGAAHNRRQGLRRIKGEGSHLGKRVPNRRCRALQCEAGSTTGRPASCRRAEPLSKSRPPLSSAFADCKVKELGAIPLGSSGCLGSPHGPAPLAPFPPPLPAAVSSDAGGQQGALLQKAGPRRRSASSAWPGCQDRKVIPSLSFPACSSHLPSRTAPPHPTFWD